MTNFASLGGDPPPFKKGNKAGKGKKKPITATAAAEYRKCQRLARTHGIGAVKKMARLMMNYSKGRHGKEEEGDVPYTVQLKAAMEMLQWGFRDIADSNEVTSREIQAATPEERIAALEMCLAKEKAKQVDAGVIRPHEAPEGTVQ